MREDKNLKANLAASYNELVRSFTALSCETIGNYTLGREVGKGSYGHAYQATHKFLGGKVVLKGTPKSEAPTLAREIHHHRRLHHPHIVQLYEVIVTEQKVWLVLEHCGGGELYEYLLKRRQLTERETQKIFAQICGAVAYIHARGIVHRDLKLENIFLDRKNNAKLGDFGFARENDKGFLKTWCGSTAYSAPEILQCAKYQGEAVDVWSLGIILFALLSGQLPYDEEDELVTKRMILESQPVCPPFFSDEVRQLIASMLNKDPEKRPTVQEILHHPFLSDFAPEQLDNLARPYEPTFMTRLEKTMLERMSVGGINTEKLMDSVLDYSCDSLCGWWWLSLKRERRRERKQRHQRRLSGDNNNTTDLRDLRTRSRSRPRSVERSRLSYRFPSESNSSVRLHRDHSEIAAAGSVRQSPTVASSPVVEHSAPALYSQFKSNTRIDQRETEADDHGNELHGESSQATPQRSVAHPPDGQLQDSANRKELGQRKQSILATLREWWADQTTRSGRHRGLSLGKSSKSSSRPPTPKAAEKQQQQQVSRQQHSDRNPPTVQVPTYRPRSRSRDSRGSSVTFVRTARPTRPGMPHRVSSSSSVASRRRLFLVAHENARSTSGLRSPSPAMSSHSYQQRPEIARTVSASSAQSSAASFGHPGAANVRGHSKASSTSSNSTFASTRSLRVSRNPLKVMPSTPPPYMIAHGQHRERNVFESALGGSSNSGSVVFATRKKRGALMQSQPLHRGKDKSSSGARRPMAMNEEALIEEDEEEDAEEEEEEVEDESEFVDVVDE